MAAPVLAAEHTGSRVYKVGRLGLDTGSQDTGGVYTATLRTDRFSPAGENGLALFRRVALRIWHTGSFSLTMKVYVDGVQTKVYSSGAQVDQVISFTQGAPVSSPAESVLEADISAQGTFVEVELSIDSDDITGVFLPESLEVHMLPIRQSKSRSNAEAT